MTHKFKVGDRVRLEGVVVGCGDSCFKSVRFDGGDNIGHNWINHKAMAHATLIEPARPELKSGQVWEDASGNRVRIEGLKMWTEKDDKFMLQGFIEGSIESRRNYNTEGVRYCEDATGPSYLVKLLDDVAAHTEPCKGTNCGCMNGIDHSPECEAEHAAAIAGGKFVKPKPKAPPILDTSKPIRIERTGEEIRYIGRMSDGRIVGEYSFNGALQILDYRESELENIPEPKPTYEVTVGLVPFTCGPSIRTDFDDFAFVHSRASVTYTEGEGWSIEDIQP
jgi:hypothetical protein